MNPRLPENLQEKLDNLARKPGVYLFKDKKGEIIYIGKAVVLRQRVRSYFQDGYEKDYKTQRLVSRIVDLETIITDSEVEALILEANLVREYKPRYNINLRDDKSFPYIRVTNEPFPRIFPTRKIVRDGSRYFGPYTEVQTMRELLKTVKRLFPVRSCNLQLTDETIKRGKFKVCLDYHIKKCQGPCQGLVSREEYRYTIDYIVSFIAGRSNRVVDELKARMQAAAQALRFEEAARLRDQLNALEIFTQRQKIVDGSLQDRDILAMAIYEDDACCVVFKVREGKVIGRQHFFMSHVEGEMPLSVQTAFIEQYYLHTDDIPAEILVPENPGEEMAAIQNWLSQKRNGAVELVVPQRGDKAQLLKMCQRNAQLLLDELRLQREKSVDFIAGSVKALQTDLKLPKAPIRIEAFDISNIQGTDPVASMVCAVNGKAMRSEYRRFRIRTKSTPDDFAMMHEVVQRRYQRLLAEHKALPDLILIDGGKGQLNAALDALKKVGIHEQPIIALAKRLDEVFIPGMVESQMIKRESSGLRLLQRIRDEAHRFAITYHRSLRKKRTLHSDLETITGLGPARRDALLRHFGSMKKIKAASVEELQTVKGVSLSLAKEIYGYFHPENSNGNKE
jgi:excinuclease ABC subunit C